MKLERSAIPFIFDVPAYRIARRLTILIDQPWNGLSDEARTTLYKLIQALNIPGKEVPVIQRTVLKKEEIKVLNTSFIISFGVQIDSYRDHDRYQLHQLGDTAFVLADSLNIFSGDKNLKQKLWQLLQLNFRRA